MLEESAEDGPRFGEMEAIDKHCKDIGCIKDVRKRGGWLAALLVGEMLTASAVLHYEADLAQAVVLALFIPLIMSSGGTRARRRLPSACALALSEVRLADWWHVALREVPIGVTLGTILALIGMSRIALWQDAGSYD